MSQVLTASADVKALCDKLRNEPFVTIDTEFVREKTYYSQLCLVQLAGAEDVAAIDPLAAGIDLNPLFDLLADSSVIKVFHAARQDVEIFVHMTGQAPAPLFDTQVAAMVCGYGDQVGYDRLVQKITGEVIDKGSRFTDWSRRPLTTKQIDYALGDVTHLRDVYIALRDQLEASGRLPWVEEELAEVASAETYKSDPDMAWKRLKARNDRPKFLTVLRELAAYREKEAQRKDLPRNRLLRDDVLLEVAALQPDTLDALGVVRGLSQGHLKGSMGKGLLAAVKRGMERVETDPVKRARRPQTEVNAPLLDLLRVLLKAKADQISVAPRVIASSSDLESLARGDMDSPVFEGWRMEYFGTDVKALMDGRLSLTVREGKLVILTD